jgi:hypothetical protein
MYPWKCDYLHLQKTKCASECVLGCSKVVIEGLIISGG